ncbi:G1/S-specific cyclin Cln1p [Monosporozyma unispora]
MPGLIVTARQTYYPIELSNSELLSHFNIIREYNNDITIDCLRQFKKFHPDWKLIDQQPEMIPQLTRQSMITFLYKLSIMSKVTNGIFYHATRLYDRYCSKRIILRDQAKLVLATCLWLSAKTYGGCNHIINNYVIPTGGRFYGPNPRARIPRLSELVHYCNKDEQGKFDESMFCQMELHILDTLNWNVYEPSINDFILNVDENCLIQYELYQQQLNNNQSSSNKRDSQNSTDTDATLDDIDDLINEDKELLLKIQLINLKRFLIDLSCWQYDLLKYDINEIVSSIFHLINNFTDHDVTPFLSLPNSNSVDAISKIFINNLINNIPQSLLQIYKEQIGIVPFVFKVKEYYSNLQMLNIVKLPTTQYFDTTTSSSTITDSPSSIESSPQLSVTTPSRQQFTINSNLTTSSLTNTGNKSDNSIFSNHHYPYMNNSTISPITTPQLYSFNKENNNNSINKKVHPIHKGPLSSLRNNTDSQQNTLNNI